MEDTEDVIMERHGGTLVLKVVPRKARTPSPEPPAAPEINIKQEVHNQTYLEYDYDDVAPEEDPVGAGIDRMHYNTVVSENVEGDQMKSSDEHGITCTQCGMTFDNLTELTSHRDEEHRAHMCSLCKERVVGMRHLNKHLETVHSDTVRFLCNECGNMFAHKEILEMHIKIHEKSEFSECAFCKKCVPQEEMAQHVLTHNEGGYGYKPYFCGICDRSFKFDFTYEAHLRSHEEVNDSGQKEVTGQEFQEETENLVSEESMPEDTEQEVKKFVVYSPPKNDSSEQVRLMTPKNGEVTRADGRKKKDTRYDLTMTENKPYECDECDQAFRWKVSLQVHKRNHEQHRHHPSMTNASTGSYRSSSTLGRSASTKAAPAGQQFLQLQPSPTTTSRKRTMLLLGPGNSVKRVCLEDNRVQSVAELSPEEVESLGLQNKTQLLVQNPENSEGTKIQERAPEMGQPLEMIDNTQGLIHEEQAIGNVLQLQSPAHMEMQQNIVPADGIPCEAPSTELVQAGENSIIAPEIANSQGQQLELIDSASNPAIVTENEGVVYQVVSEPTSQNATEEIFQTNTVPVSNEQTNLTDVHPSIIKSENVEGHSGGATYQSLPVQEESTFQPGQSTVKPEIMPEQVGNVMSSIEEPSMTSLRLESETWSTYLCQQLTEMQQNQTMCDVTLLGSDNQGISVHSGLVAAASPCLKNLLVNLRRGQHSLLKFDTISSDLWRLLLEFMYTGKVEVPIAQVDAILTASNSLQIEGLATLCVDLLQQYSATDNIIVQLQIEDWCSHVCGCLHTLWAATSMCDTTITSSDGQSLLGLACVISAASPTILSILHGMKSGLYSIKTDQISYAVWNRILNFIYTGQCEVPVGNELAELYSAVDQLNIDVLKSLCADCLVSLGQAS